MSKVYVENDGTPEPSIHVPTDSPRVRVMVGAHTEVEVAKLYGPLVAYGVRVRLDFELAEWVVIGEFPVYCAAHAPDGPRGGRRWMAGPRDGRGVEVARAVAAGHVRTGRTPQVRRIVPR